MKLIKTFIMPLLLVVICGFLLRSAYVEVKNRAIDQLNSQQLIMADTAARGIESFFEHYTGLLAQLSETKGIASVNEDGMHLMQMLYRNYSSEIKAITRVSASGLIIYTFPERPGAIGSDISSQKHIQAIMQTRQPVISDVFDSVQGFVTIAVHVPVFENGVFKGSLGILIPFDEVSRHYMEPIKIGKSGYAWIISHAGVELYCPVPGHTGKSVFENCKDFPTVLSMAQEMVKGNRGTTTYFFDRVGGDIVKSVNKHAAYVPVHLGSTFWSIVVATPEDEVLDAIQGFRDRWFLIIGVLMLATITWSYYVFSAFKIVREEEKRKQAETALRLSEKRLRRAEEVAHFGNWEFKIDRNEVKASDGAKIIYGLQGNAWSISNVQRICLREYRPLLDQALKGLIEEAEPYNVEFKIQRPTDRRIIDIHSIAEYSAEKRTVFGVIQDITERKRAEEALRESEELYRTLGSLSPDAISVADPNGVLTFSSTKARQVFGHSSDDDILGRSLLSWVAPEEQEKASMNVRHLLTEDALIDTEYTLIRQDGTRFIGEVNAAVVHSPDGSPMRMIIITRDITERKRAEEALRQSERNYREIFNTANDAIFVHDADTGTILDVNESMLHLYGFSHEEALRLSPNDSSLGTSPYSAVEVRQWMAKAIEEGPQVFEWLARKKSGELFWVEVALKSANISGQRRMLAIVRDITERKGAEDALRESEERFSRFFRASPVGTSITRLNGGQFVDVNDAFLSLFGYTREGVIGKNPLTMGMWANPNDRVKMVEILQEQDKIQDFETQFLRQSGEIRDVRVSAEVIELAGERYILGLTHDITERKKAMEEKEKLEAQLFQAQKMESVGRLAGGVAHDFNNMLGVIIGRTELALQENVLNDKLRNNLQEILKAGLRSADLTRQLLAFARKQTAVPKILDLNDTIAGMLKMLRRLIGEDIDLSWQPGPDLWKVKIDPSQVDQILANLAVNAGDAISGVGTISMRTGNIVINDLNWVENPEFVPGDYVQLTVSDSGEGMSQEVCEKIFEPFFTTKELGKGTGLGLSTVYGIVKQNDGFIYVASELGKGTTFKIYLRRFEAETAQVPSEEIAGNRPTGTETILLVEDDEAILSLSKTILETLGYTVLAAQTPAQAIHLVEEHPGDIHILITDVVMPEMNGRELAERLSNIRPNLKCLYMSGYTADVIAHRGILDEGLNFIQKPFGSNDLAARVREILDHLE